MKKKYVSPAITVCDTEVESSILSGSSDPSVTINPNEDIFEGRVNENGGFEDIWSSYN